MVVFLKNNRIPRAKPRAAALDGFELGKQLGVAIPNHDQRAVGVVQIEQYLLVAKLVGLITHDEESILSRVEFVEQRVGNL